jgi:nicotinate-nucleotide adenylyltransferase
MATATGVYGGTFDPVHKGHVSAVHSFLNSGLIEELWVVLTPDPPHKKEDGITPFSIRLEMLRTAFEDADNVIVSDVEQHLPPPSYTIHTIRHLKERYPRRTFYLCIGEDSFVDFEKWYKARQITEECRLLVVERPGSRRKQIPDWLRERTDFISHEPVDISSTELRRKIAKGEKVQDELPENVLKIINKHNLYRH